MIKKNSNKISGWIILDKQSGITSRQAVSKISKIFKLKKVGHGGTLDPLATGILPIALGEATKLISFIQNKKKKYSFTIKWGEATDTDDIEGMILKKSWNQSNSLENLDSISWSQESTRLIRVLRLACVRKLMESQVGKDVTSQK